MNEQNKQLIRNFIERIWNQAQFDQLDKFLHTEFTDHSLPPVFPTNKDGLQQWIVATGKSFEHKTFIQEIVSEENKVMIKLKMNLKHIGFGVDWIQVARKFIPSVIGFLKS